MYSQLSRCNSVRGSNSGFSLRDLNKVKARKWPFINYVTHLGGGGSTCVTKCCRKGRGVTEVLCNPKVHIIDFMIISQFVVLNIGCDKNGNMVSKKDESCHI